MLELAERLLPVVRAGEAVAVATSIDITGSTPHHVGTSLALTAGGDVVGNVSGGCVDAAALEGCAGVLAGRPAGVARYGFGDEDAARAGLSCGGELDVVTHLVRGPAVAAELAAAAAGRPAAVGVVTTGPAHLMGRVVCGGEGARADGDLADHDLADHDLAGLPGVHADRLRAAVAARVVSGRSGLTQVACGAMSLRLFVEVGTPAARLVLVGATELAAALAALAARVGYAVSVCDPRPAFATPRRVPDAVEVVSALPHAYLASTPLDSRSVVCVLSHDEDLDPLALAVALEREVGFVGALGSRATHARRLERLAVLGVPPQAAARVRAPVGLDLGASTPAETAVSILAEVLAVRGGASGRALTDGAGPIHRRAPGVGALGSTGAPQPGT